jgi:glutathione S-transferase
MLKIWGRMSSINVRKVMFTVQELGVAHERIDAGAAFGVVDTPAFRALNPNAMVPAIDDDGYRLWESNVIVRYLAAKHSPGQLYPEGLAARFDAERWMDWQQTTQNPAGRDAFLQLIRVPAEKRQPDLIAHSVAAHEALLALLDNHLAKRRWMLGDSFTVADIPIACEMHRWWSLPLPHPARPHLRRWYEAVRARPASHGVLDMTLS